MVDQEPNRSVQLLRRIDTRVPSPLLSSTIAQAASSTPSLGKLANLRAPVAQLPRPAAGPSRTIASTPTPPPGARGWTSVVARPTSAQANAAPNPNAWLLGGGAASGSAMPSGPAPAAASATAPRPRPVPSPAPAHIPPVQANVGDVPDNWEDEV